MHFVENAEFKMYSDICWPPLPYLFIDELPMDKTVYKLLWVTVSILVVKSIHKATHVYSKLLLLHSSMNAAFGHHGIVDPLATYINGFSVEML